MKSRIFLLIISLCIMTNIYSENKYSFNPLIFSFTQSVRETLQLYQDKDGYIWIATINGLYQYDGYQLKSYKTNVYTPNVLSNNTIFCMLEDNDFNLWIGTSSGLNVLNKKQGTIKKVDTNVFDHNYISSIAVIEDQQLVVGSDRGVYLYDKNSNNFVLAQWGTKKLSLPRTTVQSLLKDSQGHLWIGTWSEGLYRYDTKSHELYKYNIDKRNSAHTLFEDNKGRIWIGTWGEGVYMLENQYNMNELKWTHFTNEDSKTKLIDNIIYTISEDINMQSIWIGTRSGLSVIEEGIKDDFKVTNYKAGSVNDMPYNEISSIIRDRTGMMWLGMLGGGVCTVNTQTKHFLLNSLLGIRTDISSNSVRSILVDENNTVWMGIGSYGLVAYDPKNNKHIHFKGVNTPFSINSTVNAIAQSRVDKKLYFGTDREGLFVYDRNSKKINNLLEENSKLKSNSIMAIKEDDSGIIWIGTRAGVNIIMHDGTIKSFDNIKIGGEVVTNYSYQAIEIDREGNIWLGTATDGIVKISDYTSFRDSVVCNSYNSEKGTLINKDVQCIFQDSKGRIWTGSESGGLSLYNRKDDKFLFVNDKLNISSDAIYSIQEDEKGILWMGTGNGLLKLNVPDDISLASHRLYTIEHGLQDNFFIRSSSYKTDHGEMYFGGHNGYNKFVSLEVVDQGFQYPATITDIKIFNKSWSDYEEPARNKISKLSPNFTNEIVLSHTQNNFSIDFVSLNYANQSKIKYSYKLDNFDDDWQSTDASHRFAYYNNLKSGVYYFRLKSSDESGVWQERALKIKIIILPPPWATWWAYVSYLLIVVLIIYFVQRSIRNKIALREQLRLKELQKSKLEEVNHTKLQFFTNVTHELLTPLTITSAALDELKLIAPTYKEFYSLMENNINRLVRLLQQILEFRKAETGNLKLKVSKGDLALFIKNGVDSFKPLMRKKDIHFSLICNPQSIPAYFDTDKVDKILYNLLSNASKYNSENGYVHINLSYGSTKDEAVLTIKDDGEGISQEKQKDLFKRFYEGDYRKFNTVGTGIGLSLTKDLVTLHKGDISLVSELGKGTSITVNIPINESFFAEDQIDRNIYANNIQENEIVDLAGFENEILKSNIQKNKTLLIIEDNEDLLILMVRLLSYEYRILTATNGKEGLLIVENENIDLIVSDVMMPEMDGVEFCKSVKNNFNYCHIPIILLTAKNKEEDRVEAYDSGAEGYISKPFNLSVLHSKIKNLLKAKERVALDFKKQIVFEVKNLDYTSIDEEFLEKAVACIHENMENPEFDHKQFIEEMNVSKSTLFRKLKSLTGLNASSFIRNIRLKAAYQIIEKTPNIRVTELAFAVGFNDPKYFSACFKKEFGILPSEYVEGYSTIQQLNDKERED